MNKTFSAVPFLKRCFHSVYIISQSDGSSYLGGYEGSTPTGGEGKTNLSAALYLLNSGFVLIIFEFLYSL